MAQLKHSQTATPTRLAQADWESETIHLIGGEASQSIVRTATYVVAASNAPAHVKAQADYVADGVADDVEIQAAIDALPAGGGKVMLSEGTFNLSAQLLMDWLGTKPIAIEGQGWSTILFLANGANSKVIVVNQTHQFTLRNLKIDANGVNQTDGAARGDREGIRIQGNDGLVENVWISNVRSGASITLVGDRNRVINSKITVSGTIASVFVSDAIYFDGVSSVASNNIITDFSDTGIALVSSAVANTSTGVISNNIIDGNSRGGQGIAVDHNVLKATVIGNIIQAIGMTGAAAENRGIYVGNSRRVSVTGNVVRNLLNATGIKVGNSSGFVVVANNVVRAITSEGTIASFGIYVDWSTDTIIANNFVEAISGKTDLHGIMLNQAPRTIIANNNVQLVSGSGIYVGSDSNYSKVIGNISRNNSSNATSVYRDGIHIRAATYNSIQGNTAYDDQGVAATQQTGIRESATADHNEITQNIVYGNVVAGITKVGANSKVAYNKGHVTENSGTATVANTTTTIVVTHGLATTPTRVLLTATLWSNATKAWVTTLTATQFTINVDVDPGAGTATFDWHAQVGEG